MQVESIKYSRFHSINPAYKNVSNPVKSYKIAPAISFQGKDKNPNQIVVLATECVPYSVSGGLGSVTRDMTKAYKEYYPQKDLRIMLPYYNSLKQFDIEDTNIKADFQYGVRKSTAHLFKVKNPENGVPAYFVHFPELDEMNKEYSLDDYSLFEKYAAFSVASMALLKQMKNSKEDFNPKILHTKDWHTAYAQNIQRDSDTKSIHELLNANSNFHGKINPLAAALNLFTTKQLDKLKDNPDFKREIFTLTMNNKKELLKDVAEPDNYSPDVNSLINNPKTFNKILINLANDYHRILYDKKNYYSHIELNNIVQRTFPEINWDENQDFNPTVNAIDNSDAWFTISNAHFNELLEDAYFSSYSLNNMLKLNLNKGTAVLNRIDMERYNPANPEQIKFPYNVETYRLGKQKNKDFIFNQFSRENISQNEFDKRIITNPENASIYGWLDKKYQDYPLVVNISRFDTNQKGSDIALDMAKKLLEENRDVNFIFGLPNFKNTNPKMLDDFVYDIVTNPKYEGRVVLIDGYLPINEYLAAADISVIPSRSETCGLVGYQSMRMGAIPVSSPVGSMKDCLITPDKDKTNAMGFLTPVHFSKSKNPAEDLTNTMKIALDTYDSKDFDRMIKNCMNYDSGWSLAVKKQDELYNKVLSGEAINKLTMNDISESKNNLKILRQEDIESLPQSDVLVYMAHPDDEIFFLPILKYLEQGKSVQLVYAAKGEKGHHKNGAPTTADNLAKHREQEMLSSLNCLGIKRNPVKLDYPDLEITNPDNSRSLAQDFERIIEQVRPKEVLSFGPDGITSNADHKKVGELAFRTAKRNKVNAYQIALSKSDVDCFKNMAQGAETDAFDFLTPAKDNITFSYYVGYYRDEIEKSLQAHRSQWSDAEVRVLKNFYTQNEVGITSLESFPVITEPKNMWAERANNFQNKYGKEFKEIEGGVCFRPEGENYTMNLYLADCGNNREHLWVESPVLNELYNTPGAIDKLFEKYQSIKKIPQFSDIKYIDLAITNHFGRKFKVTIPEWQIDVLHGISDELCKNPDNYVKTFNSVSSFPDLEMSML